MLRGIILHGLAILLLHEISVTCKILCITFDVFESFYKMMLNDDEVRIIKYNFLYIVYRNFCLNLKYQIRRRSERMSIWMTLHAR